MSKRTKKTSSKSIQLDSNSILGSVYEAAKDIHGSGLIDIVTMHDFESLCKEKVKSLSPAKIKQIRLQAKVSQPVFAWYLNVQPTTVKKWETGENSPSGPALRLLNVVQNHGLDYLVH